jgi:hypothetical protein
MCTRLLVKQGAPLVYLLPVKQVNECNAHLGRTTGRSLPVCLVRWVGGGSKREDAQISGTTVQEGLYPSLFFLVVLKY